MNVGIKNCSGDTADILNSDDVYFRNTLRLVNKYFNKHDYLDFLFGSVYKHKLLHGFNPKIINWSFWFLHNTFSWFFY